MFEIRRWKGYYVAHIEYEGDVWNFVEETEAEATAHAIKFLDSLDLYIDFSEEV